jgi:type I restriction enzyme S subunit
VSAREGIGHSEFKNSEIGRIPIEWGVVKLEEVAILSKAKFTRNNTESFDYIGLEHMNQEKGTINGIGNSNETLSTKNIFDKGDILFGKLRPYLRKFYLADFKGVCSTEILVIKNKNNIFNSFLFKIIQTEEFIEHSVSKVFGTKMPRTSWDILKEFNLALPPLAEQKKIANILSTVDEKIALIDNQIEETETLKKGLMQKLLTEGIGHGEFKDSDIGRIPVGWDVVSFIELADKNIKSSFTGGPFGSDLKSEHYTNSGVRIIQLQNIGDGSFINNDFVYTSNKKAEELKSCQIFPNDIILAKMAEPVARACIVPNFEKKFIMCSDGIRLKVDNTKYDTKFIFYFINHKKFRDIAIARSTGTTRQRIGLSALKTIPISIPPLAEQKQIAQILSTTDDKLEILRDKKESFQKLKKGLMQKLLTGEVRVRI